MKKLLVLTILVGFFTGCNKHVEPSMSTKEELKYPKNKHTFVSAIQKAAQNEGWEQYSPSQKCKNDTQALYFNKRIKKVELYRYKYQNRNRNKYANLYVKVQYTQKNIDVEFVDKISMNLGRVGIDSKMNEVLQEFKDAIYFELAACP